MPIPTIEQIDAAIEALIASPQVDYRVGDKSFSNSQKMEQLLRVRAMLLQNPTSPDVALMSFDALDIDVFGEDETQFTP